MTRTILETSEFFPVRSTGDTFPLYTPTRSQSNVELRPHKVIRWTHILVAVVRPNTLITCLVHWSHVVSVQDTTTDGLVALAAFGILTPSNVSGKLLRTVQKGVAEVLCQLFTFAHHVLVWAAYMVLRHSTISPAVAAPSTFALVVQQDQFPEV